jgi:hypothetical protein
LNRLRQINSVTNAQAVVSFAYGYNVTVRRSRLTPRALGVAGWRGETKII